MFLAAALAAAIPVVAAREALLAAEQATAVAAPELAVRAAADDGKLATGEKTAEAATAPRRPSHGDVTAPPGDAAGRCNAATLDADGVGGAVRAVEADVGGHNAEGEPGEAGEM